MLQEAHYSTCYSKKTKNQWTR